MPVFYPIPYAPPRRPPLRAAVLDSAGGGLAPQTLTPDVRTLALATATPALSPASAVPVAPGVRTLALASVAPTLAPASGATWSAGSPRVLTFNRIAPALTPASAAPDVPAVRVLSLGRVALSLTPALIVAAPAGRVLSLSRVAPGLSPASAVAVAPAVRVLALARAAVNLTPAPCALAPAVRTLALARVAAALTPASGVTVAPATRTLSLARVVPNLSGGVPGPQTATPTSRVLAIVRAAPGLAPASAVPLAPAVRVYVVAASASVAIVGSGVAPALAPTPRVLTLTRAAVALVASPRGVRLVASAGVTRRFRRRLPGELFTMDVTRRDVVVSSGGDTMAQVADATFADHTDATVDPSYTLAVREVAPGTADGGAFVNASPGVADVAPGGFVQRLSDGVAVVRYASPRLVRVVALDMTRTGGNASRAFAGYAAGSMAAAAASAIDARLTGATSADNPTFAVVDHAAGTYVPNPARWCAGLDLTCRAVWNNWSGDARMAGCLITRRHVVCSAHYSPLGTRPDVKFRFVGSTGATVERTVLAGTTLGNYGVEGYGADASIMTLDAAVPASVTPARFLDPAGVAGKLPSVRRLSYNADGSLAGDTMPGGSQLTLPVLVTDQDLHAWVIDWGTLTTTDYSFAGGVQRPSMIQYVFPVEALRRPFYEGVVPFDSSSPAFLFDGHAYAILLTTTTFSDASGPNYAGATMQQRIRNYLGADARAPGYDIQYADTAGFNNY